MQAEACSALGCATILLTSSFQIFGESIVRPRHWLSLLNCGALARRIRNILIGVWLGQIRPSRGAAEEARVPPTAARLASPSGSVSTHARTFCRDAIHLRAEAATVNAITRGSQHRALSAIRHRVADVESISGPMNSAT